MGMRKDYYLKEAALSLAMLKAVYLHDVVFVQKAFSAKWVKRSVQATPQELDDAGIRANVEGDIYDFFPGGGDEHTTCTEVVNQWKIEALEKIEAGEATVVALANRCGLSRQSLYRVARGDSEGLQHLYTLRGQEPILLWMGKPLKAEYMKRRPAIEQHKLMEHLV